MKKSLIALAVAGALTAPVVAQADATLYGKLEGVLQFVEDEDADLFMDDVIFGMKGSNETNIEGVSAIYQIEVEMNEDNTPEGLAPENSTTPSTRLAYAGLTGGFGTVLVGRIGNPTDVVEGYGDLSNKAGEFYGNPDRLGSALAYVTPTVGGLNGYAAAVIAGEGDDSTEDVDGYTVGANYSAGSLNLSIGYWDFDENGYAGADLSNLLIGGSYSVAGFTFGLTYEDLEAASLDSELIGVSASYEAGDLTPFIQYSDFESDLAAAEGDEWVVGAEYALGGKASVGIEYSDVDYDSADADYSQFNVSYTVKF